jgi:hypothetical protein
MASVTVLSRDENVVGSEKTGVVILLLRLN